MTLSKSEIDALMSIAAKIIKAQEEVELKRKNEKIIREAQDYLDNVDFGVDLDQTPSSDKG
jgi:hypothetical protein|tara:strand:+ start:742 stop:924 length:183 start_codon:yes stop_codon:yes gene_type:complete